MVGKLSYYRDPILRLKCENIDSLGPNFSNLHARMAFLMKKHEGVGIAANQVGSNKAMFLYNVGDGIQTIINPKIIHYSDEKEVLNEGCLSMPNFYFDIERSKSVILQGYGSDLKPVEIVAGGFLAQIFQHEVDHLNGTLLVDHLPSDIAKKFEIKWRTKKHF